MGALSASVWRRIMAILDEQAWFVVEQQQTIFTVVMGVLVLLGWAVVYSVERQLGKWSAEDAASV